MTSATPPSPEATELASRHLIRVRALALTAVTAVLLTLSFIVRRRTRRPTWLSVPCVEEDSAQRGDVVVAHLAPLSLGQC